jgi:tripartite-type tricarboxylate transporter receptor subunit TctC
MNRTIVFGIVLALFAGTAQAADDFYKGKTINLSVGSTTGGGYENHARFLAKHMPKHIPGNPVMVVNFRPAGGGVEEANHLYTTAPKDGTEVGLFNRYTLLLPILNVDQAKYDVLKFNWLGTTVGFNDNAHLFIIRAALPQKTLADMRDKTMPIINIGNDGSALGRAIPEAFGLNAKVIEGYKNNDLDAAFERSEIDGHTISYLSMMLRAPHWITNNFARPMIQFGRTTRLPALPDVPTARESAKSPEDLSLIMFCEAPLMVGYPFALPPGVPAERVAILQKAFKETMDDPDYQAEIKRAKLELTPKFPDEMKVILEDLSKAPDLAKNRYKGLVGEGFGK